MNVTGRKEQTYTIDGEPMTIGEIADMLGMTKGALYVRKHKLGVSYPKLVEMFRENMIGNDGCFRFKVGGRWMTREQIAAELNISRHTLSTWRCMNRHPDGSPASMEEAIAYFRQYLTGEKVRWQGNGGGHPLKEYRVNGRIVTTKDVMRRFGVGRTTVKRYLTANNHDMGRAIESLEQSARRRKEIERRKVDAATRKIMRILNGG